MCLIDRCSHQSYSPNEGLYPWYGKIGCTRMSNQPHGQFSHFHIHVDATPSPRYRQRDLKPSNESSSNGISLSITGNNKDVLIYAFPAR